VDGKHLDVGDMSDVSDVSIKKLCLTKSQNLKNVIICYRMKKICHQLTPKAFGVQTLSKASKRLSPYIHHAVDEKLFYQKKERCMVSKINL
jgi:hypothetical protein